MIEIQDPLVRFGLHCGEKMDTKLKRSTAFHPKIDGQTKVVSKTIGVAFERLYLKASKAWDENLIHIQYSYNMAIHTSTSKSPFETCFGYLPPPSLDIAYGHFEG
jgi:hypothetical protein